jgi:hypothetical protein
MALTKVTRSGITDNSVNAAKIEDGTIVDADITPGTITNAKLAGSIANDKLANSSITINGSAISLGGSTSVGNIVWQSVIVSDGSTVTTMVAGRGYFVNNTSAAGIVKLPAGGTAGDTIAIKDYAGNFATNKLTIQRNGHNIQGLANDSQIGTNRASIVLVYIDATKGWLYTNESNVGGLTKPLFTEATGGTITTSGDYKIHTFTGDGNFVVPQVGNSSLTPTGGPATVSYLVVAGGGQGAGGFREGRDISPSYTASPLVNSSGLTITAQTYPITVGGGGSAPSARGSNSVFSTITSTGGGGRSPSVSPGGSGAGAGAPGSGVGTGNTPPVSPPQGNNGGPASNGQSCGGGGGATEVGQPNNGPNNPGGRGGAGATTHITASPVAYAGGGGGGANGPLGLSGGAASPCGTGGRGNGNGGPANNGTANRGGGGGSGSSASGGSGIVVIRYKFQ